MGPIDGAKSENDELSAAPDPSLADVLSETTASDPSSPEEVTQEQVPLPPSEPDPAIDSTVSLPASTDDEGGEWDLLRDKVQEWLNANQLSDLWRQAKLPVQILAALILLTLVLQIYGGIIRTIDAVPLAPGLLELAGLITVANFSARRLVKTSEREKVVQQVRDLWKQVVGR